MEKINRQKLFKIALVVSGMTAKAYADSIGIERTTLYQYLNNSFTSKRIDNQVSSFIAQELLKLKIHISITT